MAPTIEEANKKVLVPVEPPESIFLDDFDEELFDLCRKDDYRGLYRVLLRRVIASDPA